MGFLLCSFMILMQFYANMQILLSFIYFGFYLKNNNIYFYYYLFNWRAISNFTQQQLIIRLELLLFYFKNC